MEFHRSHQWNLGQGGGKGKFQFKIKKQRMKRSVQDMDMEQKDIEFNKLAQYGFRKTRIIRC